MKTKNEINKKKCDLWHVKNHLKINKFEFFVPNHVLRFFFLIYLEICEKSRYYIFFLPFSSNLSCVVETSNCLVNWTSQTFHNQVRIELLLNCTVLTHVSNFSSSWLRLYNSANLVVKTMPMPTGQKHLISSQEHPP